MMVDVAELRTISGMSEVEVVATVELATIVILGVTVIVVVMTEQPSDVCASAARFCHGSIAAITWRFIGIVVGDR